ncbi:MAG: penicillin acylase family protein [Chloroflexi bacterium]|nr:penicillin acylase family protein [Chloroflexota bacterium]
MRFVRWGLKALAILVVVALVAVVGLLAAVTGRGLPKTSGTIHVAGLHGPVSVARDASGIIQISADDPHDLFVAQGYVHAQERMWQMEVWRHISSGRLSELFGTSTLDKDRYIRTLGWEQAAQRDLDAMPQDVRDALQWYADGVNAWIADQHGSFSFPFVVTALKSGSGGLGGYTPAPWTPLDSAAWQKVQAWNLGGNMDTEIFRMLADARLGDPARTDSLFPAYDASAPVITPSGLKGSSGAGAAQPAVTAAASGTTTASASGTTPAAPTGAAATTAAATTAAATDTTPAAATGTRHTMSDATASAWQDLASTGSGILALAGLDGGTGLVGDHGIGSNNWVVAGSKSKTGGALLANDPHLGFSEPSVWIMNGLHCRQVDADCPYDVAGVSFPGVPAIVLGHNAKIAWGATNVGPDVQDLYRETVDPKDPTHYLFKGQSVAFGTRTEVIKVAGGAPVAITVRSTGHGPVLNDVDDRLKDQPPITLQWTSIKEPDGAFSSIFHLNTAANFDDFRKALSTYGSPSQNFVYADVAGHIGYQMPGLVPIRASEKTGDRVRDGASGAQEWTGYITFADLPSQYDPPSGFIVTANNAAVDANYPYFIGDDWDPGYRARRITDLLTEKAGSLTTSNLRAIEMDAHPLRADTVIPYLVGAEPTTDDGKLLRDRIAAWDGQCDVDSLGCAAYVTTEFTLIRAIFDDELGPIAKDYGGSTVSWQTLIAALKDPTSPWWDNVSTPAVERQKDILAAALDRTGAQLRAEVGSPARWTWGRLHAVDFQEQTLGVSGIGPLAWYFNSGPRPVGGVDGAIQNNYYQPWTAYAYPDDPSHVPAGLDKAFTVSNGPSYRLTVDMSNPDAARIVTTTGQSGNPFDRHYGDLIDLWSSGGTVPLPFSVGAIARATVSTLTLAP